MFFKQKKIAPTQKLKLNYVENTRDLQVLFISLQRESFYGIDW